MPNEIVLTNTDSAPATLPDSACLPCSKVHLHVDADRDGVVDDNYLSNMIWSAGPSGTGAILCVNSDNDDGKSSSQAIDNTDRMDNTINGGSDLAEIGPLDIRKETNTSISPVNVVLSVISRGRSFRDYIRIFDGRSAGATEIIGPSTGDEKTFTDADFDGAGRIELGMEAVKFPNADMGSGQPAFDGFIELNLRVEAGGAVIHSEIAKVRVAPWLMFSHFDETEKVYVARQPTGDASDNTGYFIPALQAILGGKLEIIAEGESQGDRWTQDIMELGYSSVPGDHNLTSVIRTARSRGAGIGDHFAQYPGRKLLGPDFGYYETNTPVPNSSLDSFGNLECSPPVGTAYPFGRIVYGTSGGGAGHLNMKTEMRELLEGQEIQSPIPVDTGWLMVGHVDEFMSFIPDRAGTHGFKIAFASSNAALEIVRRTWAIQTTAPLFDAITLNDGLPAALPPLGANGGFLDEYTSVATVGQFMANSDLVSLQGRVQSVLDRQKAHLKAGLFLQDSDFIDLPILFTAPNKTTVMNCIALTPGSVNMLVVTKPGRQADLIVPKPFGPVLGPTGGTSEFQKAIDSAFAPNSDVSLHYVDCFMTYHTMQGEIHCGTNSKRKPPTAKWWQ